MRVYGLDGLNDVLGFIGMQAYEILMSGKFVDISCAVARDKRTSQQNKYLFELYTHLVDFYNDTGFVIDEIDKNVKFITKDFLHEYLKARFDVKTTTKMSKEKFSEYVDKIQSEWITQSHGEYEYFIPTVDILKSGYDERSIQC